MDVVSLPIVLYMVMMAIANNKVANVPSLGVDRQLSPPLPDPNTAVGKMGKMWVREEKCRAVLQEIFGVPFPKHSKFVRSPLTKRFLELDGYNVRLGIAFEHNGEQHRSFPNAYHRTIAQFKRQKYNDRVKAEECRARGIHLIIIWFDDDIETTIRTKLDAIGIQHNN